MSTSRQDYIARVRYSNDLPPPPCPPKLINTSKIHDANGIDSSNLLSSFFRREGFKNLITLDDDLGMDMNLLNVPNCIEKGNLSALGKLSDEFGSGSNLHPSDAILLTDPTFTASSKNKSVSFLRRTQYISSDEGINIVNQVDLKKKLASKKDDELDTKAELRAVEEMFDSAMAADDNTNLRHPVKKNLKAKRVWNFLPDTSMLDQKFFDIKFAGSASLVKDRNKKKDDIESENDPRYLTSMFREVEVSDQNWVTLYTTNDKNADKIKRSLDEQTENAPITEEKAAEDAENPPAETTFVYKRSKNFEGQFKDYPENEAFRHLAITFNKENETSMYVPISGKVELKKRRIDPYLEPKMKELTYDQIYLTIREPTQKEIYNRDVLRGNYDPMDFGIEDQYDDEEEEEEGGEVIQAEEVKESSEEVQAEE